MRRWLVVVAMVLLLILVPFAAWGARMDVWSLGLVGGPMAKPLVASLIAGFLAVDIFLPVPSSVLSVTAGALLGAVGGAAASFIGMTLGCLLGYELGRTGGRAALLRFVGAAQLDRLEGLGERFGDGAMVACRPVPVLAEASAIFAGMASISRGRFLLVVSLANLGISIGYAVVGAYAATAQSFLMAVGGAFSLPAVAWIIVRLATPRRVRQT